MSRLRENLTSGSDGEGLETGRTMILAPRQSFTRQEYHKVLKSGCQAERYRLGGPSTEVLLGFLTVIALQLLRVTYLNRTQPQALAEEVLRPEQLEVLKAKAPKLPKVLTVAWAIEAVARLGGYLQHRRKTPIGITVLWRGWLKLESLCEGWNLARDTWIRLLVGSTIGHQQGRPVIDLDWSTAPEVLLGH